MNSQKPERHGIDIIWQNQIDINCINSNIVENIHSQSYKIKKKMGDRISDALVW